MEADNLEENDNNDGSGNEDDDEMMINLTFPQRTQLECAFCGKIYDV